MADNELPEDLEEQVTETLSDMPCDLGSDDYEPPDEEDLEWERTAGN